MSDDYGTPVDEFEPVPLNPDDPMYIPNQNDDSRGRRSDEDEYESSSDDDDTESPSVPTINVPRREFPTDFDPSLIVTRKTVDEAREERAKGFPFRLPLTGGFAIVRELNLYDKNMAKSLPQRVQDQLSQVLQVNDQAGSLNANGKGPKSRSLIKSLESNEELSNELCIRGFLNPRLARNEEHRRQLIERGHENVILVDDIALQERHAYAFMVGVDSNKAEGAGAVSARFRK